MPQQIIVTANGRTQIVPTGPVGPPGPRGLPGNGGSGAGGVSGTHIIDLSDSTPTVSPFEVSQLLIGEFSGFSGIPAQALGLDMSVLPETKSSLTVLLPALPLIHLLPTGWPEFGRPPWSLTVVNYYPGEQLVYMGWDQMELYNFGFPPMPITTTVYFDEAFVPPGVSQ